MTVNISGFRRGTGGFYILEGPDKDEVLTEAERIRNSIDMFRSPFIDTPVCDGEGIWKVEVRYYGLD